MTTPPDLTMKPVKKNGIAAKQVDQELFLYPAQSDCVHVLNSGAALIWLLCDGVRDMVGIARELATRFNLPEQQILNDVQQTVAQLQALGLLEAAQQ